MMIKNDTGDSIACNDKDNDDDGDVYARYTTMTTTMMSNINENKWRKRHREYR